MSNGTSRGSKYERGSKSESKIDSTIDGLAVTVAVRVRLRKLH